MDVDGETAGMRATERRPLRRATAILGKKWHPVLIRTLLAEGPLGFNDLKTRVDGISDKMLSEALEDLQEAGLVVRNVVEDKPVRVNYALTPAGEELESVFEELLVWSRRHFSER